MEKINNLLRRQPSRLFFILLLLLILDTLALSFSPNASAQQNIPLRNRLANLPSPYLREAADSPVHWQSWGKQAFRLDKKMDSPFPVI